MTTTQASVLKAVRLTHLYFGVFIAPAILFFALTGALQTFSLHETTGGSTYKPARWIVVMAQLHKKQTTVLPVRRPGPGPAGAAAGRAGGADGGRREGGGAEAARSAGEGGAGPAGASAAAGAPAAAGASAAPAPPKRVNTTAMRIFFLVVTVGLFPSTLTGLYMSYRFARNKVAIGAVLLAGVVVPVVLVLLQR